MILLKSSLQEMFIMKGGKWKRDENIKNEKDVWKDNSGEKLQISHKKLLWTKPVKFLFYTRNQKYHIYVGFHRQFGYALSKTFCHHLHFKLD